ncbi:MAG TPA: hypothetical protein DD001_00670 [Microcoleaceae bacterium UBA10368]|jgi:hypothetical protein|nr:hypothetical protein [Microcoleaceae cyanobacterium UBA10368]HCV32883.1 hypothetical protein [Microcoleaceae cyanobacterium UBA9251]
MEMGTKMIDWYATGSMLAYIHQFHSQVSEMMEEHLSQSPKFQNVSYPITPLPLFLSGEEVDNHQNNVERYVVILEKLCRLYNEHQEIRDYFGLKLEEDKLVRLDCGYNPQIRICRLDGYFDRKDGSLKILENNADSPAGTLFTPRLNGFVSQVIERGLKAKTIQTKSMPLDNPTTFLEQLLATYREYGGTQEQPRLAILQVAGKSNIESQEMAREFTKQGIPTLVADPREFTFTRTGAEVNGQPIHFVWNKINTCFWDWNSLQVEHPNLLSEWIEAISERKICHVNSFASRYVAENKRCISFFQEPEYKQFFKEEEHSLLQSLLPWSRKLEPDKQVVYEDKDWNLAELLSDRQADFVLKQPYDIRGDGVTIGRSVDRKTWLDRMSLGMRQGFVVQRYIQPMTYPIISFQRKPLVLPMNVSIDSFMFGGRLVGFGSKASLEDKVNLFKGGQKLAVKVVED